MSFNPMLTYTIRFKKFEVKPNITVDYYSIERYKDVQYINGKITINSKELINKVTATFYRCDQEGINCEYFQSWTLTGICNKLKQKNQVWSRWYDSYDPPMHCPIDKVHYKMINGTIDIGPVLLWYPQATDYQWRVVQDMYADDIFVGSYTIELLIFGYRKKIKSILKL
ncbi:uncharacterized protein LOC113555266 [Rhopalosiphum maidis]|uniref:uncharacterized protein LOC113551018 n=1 Tax=Rhopalosiphum maidis TaxID=43146 RepID=UPI000F004BBB|nr:uncharacterized protein LOC113551018 [Rhopalosiphum maidis]XP_026815476.1 uncharacterized protein LOC113555266 [Rhopalosiphum maidis]